MTLWIGNGAVFKSFSQWQLKSCKRVCLELHDKHLCPKENACIVNGHFEFSEILESSLILEPLFAKI